MKSSSVMLIGVTWINACKALLAASAKRRQVERETWLRDLQEGTILAKKWKHENMTQHQRTTADCSGWNNCLNTHSWYLKF